MLVLYRDEQRWEDRMFRELPGFLKAGDCLVLNDSRVFPSRLYGHREGGIGSIDFYCEWKAVYVDYSDKLQKAQIDRPE